MKLQLIIRKELPNEEHIKHLQVRFPNQNNRLWVKANYYYMFGKVFGWVLTK